MYNNRVRRFRQVMLKHAEYFQLNPVIAFAISLIALACVACGILLEREEKSLWEELRSDSGNIAIAVEHNLIRTTADLDRILQFLRANYKKTGSNTDWPSVLREPFTFDDHSVQIAIIDANGSMITSSAMLYPKTKVDLSDREHFRVHVNSTNDSLFISKPVLGRASGKWSIQFTRKLTDQHGTFGGVIVISLDPKYLARAYSGLSLGSGNGLAVVSKDGIVLSGSGIFESELGKAIIITDPRADGEKSNSRFLQAKIKDKNMLFARRDLENRELSVFVVTPAVNITERWIRLRATYLILAVIFIIGVIFAAIIIVRHNQLHKNRIIELARRDALTGLENRNGFNFLLHQRLKQGQPDDFVALHIIDLDRFKDVNDTFGHHVGDILLSQVATRLASIVRRDDSISRLGGDEFAVVHSVESQADATALAERICSSIAMPFLIDERQIFIAASVGTTIAIDNSLTPSELLIQADLAMYAAKHSGRNTNRLYASSMSDAALRRSEIETELRVAIEKNTFTLHYQPITHSQTGVPSAAEALLRWTSTSMGTIAPTEFIRIAEQCGLIIDLGSWVLRTACAQFVTQNVFERLAVNCSAAHVRHESFTTAVKDALFISGLRPDRLEIEITESILLDEDDSIMKKLQDLRSLGVRISIDDFGTGYSSLSYLDRYPIDVVKIDKSFVHSIGKKRSAIAIIRSVIAIARSLNMSVIAEGVETQEQLEFLRSTGCHETQGFLLGVPKPMAYWLEEAEVLTKVA